MALKDILQKQTLQDVLVGEGLLTEDEFSDVIDNAKRGVTEFQACAEAFSGRKEILRRMAEFAQCKMVALLELPKLSQDIINEIPRQMIADMKIMPIGYQNDDKNYIVIAMSDPLNQDIIENLELRTNKNMVPVFAIPMEIEKMISKYYGDAAALEAANAFTSAYQEFNIQNAQDLTAGDSPIITVVNSILEQAARMKTSDIHIEPFEDRLRIRYRIDGALTERPSFSMQLHSAIMARLKIIGGMDIAEKRIPQDGRITFMVDKTEYDIRVSMLPTVYGEKCVMRLAIRENLQKDKKDLGLSDYDMKIFDKIFSNPNGIILVTGPTGSGKSTTLYTALNELSTEEVNVITVEDPVEANVPGVNQVQTNVRAGLTFAAALRSILRQDPDIIMIGEIRDGETAGIAVQAAITGHLVVSTLHTNSSAATISRLINMGLEPYLVADSVVGILAQRLVRKLCPRCKVPKKATPAEIQELGLRADITDLTIYERGGCPYCNQTGFAGRTAVYEIMDVGPDIKRLIINNASTEKIRDAAVQNGMHTLHRSAAIQVVKGITTISEMRKVSSDV